MPLGACAFPFLQFLFDAHVHVHRRAPFRWRCVHVEPHRVVEQQNAPHRFACDVLRAVVATVPRL